MHLPTDIIVYKTYCDSFGIQPYLKSSYTLHEEIKIIILKADPHFGPKGLYLRFFVDPTAEA